MSEVLDVVTAADALARAAAGELLGPADLAAIFHIGHTRFYALRNAGAFDRFKVDAPIGPRCYAGVLVHRYVQGLPAASPAERQWTFGRKKRA